MTTKKIAATLVFGLAATVTSAHAQEARYLAANCANCHGTDGRSTGGGGMPGLAGLSIPYFTEQMKAFKAGTRQATVMHQIAKGYSDDQVATMARFFSQQKPE